MRKAATRANGRRWYSASRSQNGASQLANRARGRSSQGSRASQGRQDLVDHNRRRHRVACAVARQDEPLGQLARLLTRQDQAVEAADEVHANQPAK